MEAIAHEAASGGVEDALALGGAVLRAYSWHGASIKRMFALDNASLPPYVSHMIENDHSF
jgi:hypothetical protein